MKYKLKIEDIPFHQVEKLGVNRQTLEESGDLVKLLKGEKTGVIAHLKTIQDGVEKKFSAHLKLEKNTEGKLQFKIEAPQMKDTIRLAEEKDISLVKIPFKQLEKFGITQERLKKSGNLDRLLKGEKTETIHNISFIISGVEKKTSAKLYLIVTPSNSLKFQMDFTKPTQTQQSNPTKTEEENLAPGNSN